MLKKINKVFAPVILIQTFVLLISDISSILFALKLGNITDSIITQQYISTYSLMEFFVLLIVTLLLLPLLTFYGNKLFFLKSVLEDNIIYENILHQRPSKILQFDAGELTAKIIDNNREIRWAIVDRMTFGIEFSLLPIIIVYISFKTNILLTILITFLAIARILYLNYSSKIISKRKMSHLKIQQQYTDNILNISKYHDFIFFNNFSFKMSEKLFNQNNKLIDNEFKHLQLSEQRLEYIGNVIDIAYYLIILLFGSLLEKKGIVGLGTVITIVYIYQFFSKEFENISKFYKANSLLKELLKDMSTYTSNVDNSLPDDSKFDELSYNNFTINVSNKKMISYNENIIKSGCKCAIIGDNGSGKTTLLKLLSGIKENNSMNYRINKNKAICEYLKKHAIYLDSDSFLFCKCVGDYLTSTNAQSDKIKELCYLFKIDTLLSKKGSELSGGERKRIDLVHTLLENKELVLIDEPEVFLDSNWKETIIKALEKSDKTIIFTTHDKDFINMADLCISI